MEDFSMSDSCQLRVSMYKTMEETDSLLGLLLPKEAGEARQPVEVEMSTSPGQKRPKDDRTVIEELHTLNTQLRAFISQLLAQLEASEKQVEALKIRLQAYEEDTRPLPELAPLEMPPLEIPPFDFSNPPSIVGLGLPPDVGPSES